jgi:hypothetical protein
MANWLEKILPPAGVAKDGQGAGPLAKRNPQRQVTSPNPVPIVASGQLPNAALIYGIAAAALFAVALYFLFTGRWLTALLVSLPAGCFLGYALHFIKYYAR